MIRFDNGDFFMRKVRFRIPNNFFINCDPECTGDYFMELRPPKDDYVLRVRIIEDCKDTLSEVSYYLSDDSGGVAIEPPSAIAVGGLNGHQVAVAGRNVKAGQYYAHFSLPDKPTDNLVYYLEVKDSSTLLSVLQQPEVQWFINNLQYIDE